MKISNFQPLILTKDPDAAIALFEALGFVHNHKSVVTTSNGKEVTNISMKNADGFRVDVAGVTDVPQDRILIRMNVDDFQEAYDFLISKGFRNSAGDATVDTRTNKSAMMISPSGFAFDLCQHIKS